MKQALKMLFIFYIGAVFYGLPAWAQNGIELRYHFHPGETFQATFTDNEKNHYQTPNSELDQNQATLSQRSFKVLSVDEAGTATIEMKIDFIKTSMAKPDGSVSEYDTRDQGTGSAVNQLLLHPVILTVDKKGHILAIAGIGDEELDTFYSHFKPASDEEKFSLDMLVSTVFSEETIRQILPRFIFPEYPEQTVSIGDTWSKSETLDLEKFKAKVVFHYTLKSISEPVGQWHILVREAIEDTHTSDSVIMAELNKDSESVGFYLIQAATGRVESFDMNTESRFNIFKRLSDGSQGELLLTRTSSDHYTMETGGNATKVSREEAVPDPVLPQNSVILTGEEDFRALILKASEAAERFQYQTAEAILLQAEKKMSPKSTFREQVELKIAFGSVYTELGKYAQGEQALKQALDLLAQKPDPDGEIFIYAFLGHLYSQQKDFAKAQPVYQKLLALQRRGNLEHPGRFMTLLNYALLKKDMGDYQGAEPMFREALAVMRSKLGANNPDVAQSTGDLAEVLYRQKKYEEATRLLLECLLVLKNSLPVNHPYQGIVRKHLATVYLDQNQADKARPYVMEGIKIMEKSLSHLENYAPQNFPDIRICRNNLSEMYALKKRLGENP